MLLLQCVLIIVNIIFLTCHEGLKVSVLKMKSVDNFENVNDIIIETGAVNKAHARDSNTFKNTEISNKKNDLKNDADDEVSLINERKSKKIKEVDENVELKDKEEDRKIILDDDVVLVHDEKCGGQSRRCLGVRLGSFVEGLLGFFGLSGGTSTSTHEEHKKNINTLIPGVVYGDVTINAKRSGGYEGVMGVKTLLDLLESSTPDLPVHMH